MKKSFLSCLFLVLSCTLLLGQYEDDAVKLQYVIVDQDDFPLPSVAASKSKDKTLIGLSNTDGILSITAAEGDSIHFQLIGYKPIVVMHSRATRQQVVRRLVLASQSALLQTVAVVGRRDELARELPYQVETVKSSEIKLLQSQSSTDALADLSGVYVQKSQFGGGSPIVRGFEANRVLLVIDGVRMNNAIFRNGHLQNAITVDVNALNSMELIYGPGSLAYGSDALGGVIHFRTYKPAFSAQTNWQLDASINYATASKSKRLSVGAAYGSKLFASYTQLSLGDFGDLKAGSIRPSRFSDFGKRPFYISRIGNRDTLIQNTNPDLQIGTAYQQLDLLQKFRFSLADQLELKANFQLSTSSDIPRYDNLSDVRNGNLRWAEWNYGPQNRLLTSLRLDDRRARSLYDLYSIIIAHQFIEEDRITRKNGNPLRESNEVDVNSSNFQWDLVKVFDSNRQLRYGLDARYDFVSSKAYLFDLVTQQQIDTNVPTRYPSQGSTLASAGAYIDYKQSINSKITAQIGLRFSQQWLTVKFGENDPIEWPVSYVEGIRSSVPALTGAASIRYQSQGNNLRFLFAQGFRSPNVDDFAKFRERNGFIQVPNPNLKSERSNSLELGYEYNREHWKLQLTAYHTWLNDAIVREDFLLPNGSNSFISFGDTLNVQANVNADKARIWGFDTGLDIRFNKNLSFAGELHWIKGVRSQAINSAITIEVPQDHIPPLYGSLATTYKSKRWSATIRLRFQAAKAVEDYAVSNVTVLDNGQYDFDRNGTSDNLDLTAVDPSTGLFMGSYGWSTWNLNTKYSINSNWKIMLGIENLFDVHYRTFASGVSAPGRNLLLGINYQLK